MAAAKTVRTFIAVELPGEVKQALAGLQSELRQHPVRVSWTRPEGWHVTLKFLGNVEEAELDAIERAVAASVSGSPRPRLSLESAGAFPGWRNPRVLWVGVRDEERRLASIQQRLEEELCHLGFPKEKRTFRPHLTLGRVKSTVGIDAVVEALQNRTVTSAPFDVHEIVIMRSDLRPTGAVYSPLRKVAVE